MQHIPLYHQVPLHNRAHLLSTMMACMAFERQMREPHHHRRTNDGIIIASKSSKKDQKHQRIVLGCLRSANLKVAPAKR